MSVSTFGTVKRVGQCERFPHGLVFGVFDGSHPYLRCNPSLNSDLLKNKLYLFKGSTHSQFDAPFCDARFIVSFFFV